MQTESISMMVYDDSDVYHTVRMALASAAATGFPNLEQFKFATAVSELAMNIVRYARHGDITIARIRCGWQTGIEVIANDSGPGIEDIDLAMQEHFSTGGALGLGLPGVRRLMDELELDSKVGAGTTVAARKWLSDECMEDSEHG